MSANARNPSDPRNLLCDQLESALADVGDALRAMRQDWHIKIIRWPKDFARVLLIGGLKLEATVKAAVELYLESLDDLGRVRDLAEAISRHIVVPETLCPMAQDVLTRQRRHVHRQAIVLSELDVTINEVLPGTAVNPEFHEVVDTIVPANGERADTVAEALTPLFTWRDEHGLTQVIAAKVVVYADSCSVSDLSRVPESIVTPQTVPQCFVGCDGD